MSTSCRAFSIDTDARVPVLRAAGGARRGLVVLGLWLGGCALPVSPGVFGTVDPVPDAPEKVHMVYLGSGGWIFEYAGEQILAGPLFSNPGLFQTGLWSIRSDTALVDRYMSRYDVSAASAILVGHAHYDHLMDVPRVASHHAPDARIVGSETVRNTLGTWSGLWDRVDLVNDSAATQVTPGRWLRYGDRVRVLPLATKHAPHFEGYTLYQGHRDRPLESEPRRADQWVDGDSFSYLVDFLAPDGSVAFRIYYQDAVSAAPAGFAPEARIAEHPVDVAIFVPATFDQVDWHPEAFVENLRPARVLLGHWENFFQPIAEPTASILLTDMGDFEGRLENVHAGPWWRPEIFTDFFFPVR